MGIKKLIEDTAKKHGLEPEIVYGVCVTESGLNSAAVRFEPFYKWLYKPESVKPSTCSLETEKTLQKMSYGLMQVLGGVFREYGYTGWLTAIICDPQAQLDYGCKHLAKKIAKYGRDEGILSYNSGSPIKNNAGAYINAYYLAKVLENSKKF